jgi:Tfp pilus assembly protein PilO
VSYLTREYNLSEISLHTDEVNSSAPGSAVVASTAAQKAQLAGDSGAISSLPIRLSFAGDFREIAYFLEALQNLPRMVRVDSLKMQRGVPLVVSEVGWKAYYKNGDLLVLVK